jgi:hypothetical protein
MDAQSLAVLALMSCAQPVEKTAMKNNRLLSPLAPGDGYENMILGNLLLMVLIGGLHCLSAVVVSKVKKVTMAEAQALVRFPTFTLVAMTIQYQGTAAAAIKLLQASNSPPSSKALGGITIVLALMIPVSLLILARTFLTAGFQHYNFDSFPETHRMNAVMKVVFPVGRWYPREMRHRFSSLFSGLRRRERIWVTLPTWSPTIIIVALIFEPPGPTECVIQFSCVAALQFFIALILLGFRPYRSLPANVLSAASNICIGFVLSGSALLADHPESQWAVMFMLRGVQAQMAVTVLRLLWSGIQFCLETKYIREETPTIASHEWQGQSVIGGARRTVASTNDGPMLPLMGTGGNNSFGRANTHSRVGVQGVDNEVLQAANRREPVHNNSILSPLNSSPLGSQAVAPDPFADCSDEDSDLDIL